MRPGGRELAVPQDTSALAHAQEVADSAVTNLSYIIERWTTLAPSTQGALLRSILLIVGVIIVRAIALRVMRARVDDIRVRYKRLTGAEVLYICGSDEHGAPILVL